MTSNHDGLIEHARRTAANLDQVGIQSEADLIRDLADALASLTENGEGEAQPVAWRCARGTDAWVYYSSYGAAHVHELHGGVIAQPLYASPAIATTPVADVPSGEPGQGWEIDETATAELREIDAALRRGAQIGNNIVGAASPSSPQVMDTGGQTVADTFARGFVTCNSDGQNSRYEVVAKFQTLKEAQNAHSALVHLIAARRA